jgi:hypothetical protein
MRDLLRRIVLHPLAAPVLVALLVLDLWLTVPPSGFEGGSAVRSIYWRLPPGKPPVIAVARLYRQQGDRGQYWSFGELEMLYTGPPALAEVVIVYTPDDRATGLWAITRSRREHRITLDDRSSRARVGPEEIAALRQRVVDELIAPATTLPLEAVAQLRTGDYTEERTIWTGYVHDAAVIPMLSALPFACFGAWRAARDFTPKRRRRRGLCPACAYSRAGLAPDAPCPECGNCPECGRAAL